MLARSLLLGAALGSSACAAVGKQIDCIATNAAPGSSAQITEYSHGITPGALLPNLTVGPDGALRFTELGVNGVGRLQ